MMKRILFIVTVFVTAFSSVQAQQFEEYSMHMFDKLYINPAYAGSRDLLSASALARFQWVQIDGSQRSVVGNIHSPLKNDKNALGFSFRRDGIGVSKNLFAMASYAYRIPFDNNSKLSLGLQGGIINIREDLSEVRTGEDNDPAFQDRNFIRPNFGAGLYWYGRKYYLGASVPYLLTNSLDPNGGVVSGDEANRIELQYNLMGGYVFGKETAKVKFKPTALLRYMRNTPFDAELNANFLLLQDILWLGVGYRFGGDRDRFNGDAIIGLAEILIAKQFRIGYAYDYTVSELGRHNTGSHELFLAYELARQGGNKDKRFVTPRYIRYF